MVFRGYSAHLEDEDVELIQACIEERIRLSKEAQKLSNAQLAKKFDVPSTTIQRIANGTWTGLRS